ncbi:hypothetical protein EC991_006403 [Linnemannia zychae]|nr:hypothetical protein EC991_006403 [Linnemannia zychae]
MSSSNSATTTASESSLKNTPTNTTPKGATITSTTTITATSTTTSAFSESSAAMISPSTLPVPDAGGDTDLTGKPSVVGGFNLTTGIVVCGSIIFVFLVVVGAATLYRAKSRRAFRRQLLANGQDGGEDGRSPPRGGVGASYSEKVEVPERAMPGRDGGYEGRDDAGARRTDYTSAPPTRSRDNRYPSPHAALYRQASMSRRGLMSDAAPINMSEVIAPAATTTTTDKRHTSGSRSGSRGASRSGSAPSSVNSSPAPTVATILATRPSDNDFSSQPDNRSSDAKKSRHPPAPTVTINYKSPTAVAKRNSDYEMTAYSPEPVGHDDEIDSASDFSSPHPLQRDSLTAASSEEAPLDAYHSGAFLNAIHEYTLYSSPLSVPLPAVDEPASEVPKVQSLQPVYHSRGQQGYQSQTQTTQQKRQSPPPPPKSLKRLSPVSTTNISKNYQQAQPVSSTAAATRGIQRTGFTPRIATHDLTRSGSGQSPSSSSSPRGGTPRSNTDSPTERLNNKFAQNYYTSHHGRNTSPIPAIDSYPTPIARSNSTRLPAHLRGGGSVIGMQVGAGGGQQVGATFVSSYGNASSNYF